jgi:superfamily I DNA/RNA helicase
MPKANDPVHRALSDNEEGGFVAHSIFETKMQNQVPNKGFAILYRTNAQSRSMEEALRKLNIPYRIYGGMSFYQRKEIKDLISYFRLVCNPNDEEALKRVINYPTRGIGQTTMDKLMVTALAQQHLHLGPADPNMRSWWTYTVERARRLADFVLMIRELPDHAAQRRARRYWGVDRAKHRYPQGPLFRQDTRGGEPVREHPGTAGRHEGVQRRECRRNRCSAP